MRKGKFTPEEDDLIIRLAAGTPIYLIARKLDRKTDAVYERVQRLRKRGLIKRVCRIHRPWTQEEEANLLKYTKTMTMAEAARLLGRTEEGCLVHLGRMPGTGSIQARQGRGGMYSSIQLGKLFGVNDRIVRKWMYDGQLTGQRLGAKQRYRYFTKGEVYRFLRDHPKEYEPYRMEEGPFKAYAEKCRREYELTHPDHSITPAAAARIKGCTVTPVHRACRLGRIKAEKRPGLSGMEWFIDPASLGGWEPAQRGGAQRRKAA